MPLEPARPAPQNWHRTGVDATLIAVPTSTKNKGKARDPEIRSSQKGNQWYLGMKAHIGADADSRLVCILGQTKTA